MFQTTRYEFCGGYWWIFPSRGCGRRMCGFGDSNDPGESAMDILNKRYAKGDVDQREYEEKKPRNVA